MERMITMSEAEKFLSNFDDCFSGWIEIKNGEVWGMNPLGEDALIGKIGRIELAIEYPENMVGISRIEHVMLKNEDGEDLYNDQDIVDNAEFHSDDDLIDSIANRYGVSSDVVETV